MNNKALVTLELPAVLDQLAARTAFSASRELAVGLEPVADRYWVERRQEETAEAFALLAERPDFSVRGARDVRQLAKKAELGGILDPLQLLSISGTLRAGHAIVGTLKRLNVETFRVLQEIGERIHPCSAVVAEVDATITEDGEVKDSASQTLARIRRELQQVRSRVAERLNSYLNTHRTALQEPIITTRNDRFVLPVRADHKSDVPGLVHDQSASGATLYIEPMAVVELNNAMRSLQAEEHHEVERILQEVSGAVGAVAPLAVETVESIATIDLCLAKARLAEEQKATRPLLVEAGKLRLSNARHPLLKGTVVPLSLELGSDWSQIVITGPNTGGKTVALKTVGLLTLMATCGLHIPAGDGSEIGLARDVWADIGDEQSIAQSLSTFSSHMNNIIRIVDSCSPGDLVLLDELGAGTDPVEGAALARAILDHLRARRVAVVATTHYAELKGYAHTTPGVQNASVEFDVETLSPTYRLTMGLPGRSNALAIATRLGLRPDIVKAAADTLSPDQHQFERLLAEIASDRKQAAAALTEASVQQRRAEIARAEAERRVAGIERERQRVLKEAEDGAERDLSAFRAQLNAMRARSDSAATRREVQGLQDETSGMLRELLERRHKAAQQGVAAKPAPARFVTGEWVHVESLDQVGQVVSLASDGSSAEVQIGRLKVRAKVTELQPSKKPNVHAAVADRSPIVSYEPAVTVPKVGIISSQLDLRGKRAADVDLELDRFLNDASRAGVPFARIVHGKGTGALRQVVQEQLTGHPLVRSFRNGEAGEGGDGVTIAML